MKNQHVFLFNYALAIALSLLFAQAGLAQSSENQQIVFEGNLTDTSGNPIDLSGAQLTFYVSTSNCYLYGESSTTAGDSQGNIIHRIGGGSQVAGSPNSFTQNLFFGMVSGTTAFAGNNCTVMPADTRLAQVFYPAQNISATIKLGTVPYSHNATMLNGKNAADFVQHSDETNTVFYSGSAGQFLSRSASGVLTWSNSSITAAQVTTALGYTPASAPTALTASSVTTALGYTPANTTALSAYTQKSNNLADITSSATARTNLGLGSFATANSIDLGTASATGTLATGRLPAFIGDASTVAGSNTITVIKIRGVNVAAIPPTANQVLTFTGGAWTPASAATGTVTNITAGTGLLGGSITSTGTISVSFGTTVGSVAQGNDIRIVQALQSVNNLSDLGSSATARANLGLGSLATVNSIDLGTANATGTLATGRLPAFIGDATTATGSNTITVNKLRGINISVSAPTTSQVLAFDGTQWKPTNTTVGTVTNIFAGTGLLGGPISSSGTLSINFGTTSGSVAAGNDNRILQALQSVNNLSELTNSATARANLGLGMLATKSIVNLSTDVSGTLPIASGGSPWLTHANGYYISSNASIGSSTVLANTKLLVEGNSPSQVARFINSSASGYGVRIDVAGNSSAQYALNVNNGSASMFMVQNDGNIGINTMAPAAKLHIVTPGSEIARLEGSANGAYVNLFASGTQRGAFGYGNGATLFANELSNSVGIRSEGSLQLGIGAAAHITIANSGTVGIGTTTPAAKLHVGGAVVSKPHVISSGTSVDLFLSNMFILNSVGGSANSAVLIPMSNMVDGGTYTLIITDPVAHTYTFGGCNNSYYAPANSLTVTGTRTIFGLITLKNGANWDCYINWTPGYQ